MRILTIETSTRFPSIAVLDVNTERTTPLAELFSTRSSNETTFDGQILTLAENIGMNERMGSSHSLLPAIQIALGDAKISLKQVSLIIVNLGPGSFTGLRTGIVTAKTISFAMDCPVVGVAGMEVLAWQACQHIPDCFATDSKISVGINVGRGESYHCEFVTHDRQVTKIAGPTISSPENWIDGVKGEFWITGSGAELLSQVKHDESKIIPKSCHRIDVVKMSAFGVNQFLADGPGDMWTLEPIYSRPSAAEE
ncbi:MAG: tRNA (adenosine(37)-N6)-threonylcarbamoyltransferase complex dimerization subunit type 1 TsaB, partial [Planctomycetota bacterium]